MIWSRNTAMKRPGYFASSFSGSPPPFFLSPLALRREIHRVNAKVIALIVLIIALFGLVYSIESTARPPSMSTRAAMSGAFHVGW